LPRKFAADYEDDREALRKLYTALNPFVDENKLVRAFTTGAAFAMWRRVVNGFNDGIARKMESDAKLALAEFQAANAEPKFSKQRLARSPP
jgi:hypothetical protein